MQVITSTIDNMCKDLEESGATNVAFYRQKLLTNSNNTAVFEDLLVEGRAALMFLQNGFGVRMRESPDLRVELGDDYFYAEIKHFREKEQDRLDDERLKRAFPKLVEYGDTMPTEGVKAWQQVVDVAKRKADQYKDDAPNILVVVSSSSHCIEDPEVLTATHRIDEMVANGECPDLRKLNGILLMTPDYNSVLKRSVYFFPTRKPNVSLTSLLQESLDAIRIG